MSKETVSLKASRIFLLTAVSLLAGSSLARPVLAAAKAETAEAKTGWAISRVASMTQGSYCTMAQKFGNNSVVTIGQNTNGEYSLAFDFQEAKFKAGKKLTASVRVGSGSAQTFEIEPQTSQTLVLGVGADAGFAKSLKESPLLQLDVSGDSFSYKLARIEDGQSELATCLSGLKSPSLDGGSNKGKATGSKADKLEQARAAEPKAEDILQAEPSSGGNVGDDILQAQEENLRLKSTLGNAKEEEKKSLGRDNPALGDLQEKLRVLENENSDLRKKAEAQDKAPKVVDLTADLKKAEVDLDLAKKQNADMQAQISTLEKGAQGQKEAAEKLVEIQKDLQKSQRDMTTFKAENETLRNQVKIGAKAGESGAAESLKLADLQAENAKLLAEIDALKNRPQPDLADAGKDTPQEIKELKEKIAALQMENTDLKARDVQAAAVQPAAGADDAEQRAQLRALKGQIDTLTSENGLLKNTLEKVQKESEKSQLKAAGGNWDLEQATRRFQESQREIRRLGALLEGQKAKCVQEKKDIEYMLFDPELAKSAQISMLGTLEDQLIAKDLEISRLKETAGNGGISPEQLAQLNSLKEDSAQKAAEISELKAQLAQSNTQASGRVEQEAQLRSAKDALSQKEAKLAELEKKLSEIEGETTNLSAKSQTDLLATKAQLDERTKKVADLEAQLAAVKNETSTKLGSLAQKDADYALLQKQLREAQTQVSLLNSKAQTDGFAVKAQLDEKTKKVADLEAQLAAVRNETSTKLGSVAQKDADYALLQKQLREAQTQVSLLNSKAQTDLLATKAQLDERTKKVAELEAQLAAVRNETSTKLGSLAQKDADYALLQKQLREAQTQVSVLNSKSQADGLAVKAQLDEKTKKVADLEAQLAAVRNETSTKLGSLAQKDADYALLQKQLQEAQAQLSSFNTKSQSDQMYVKAQLDEKTKKVADLEAQLAAVKTETSTKLGSLAQKDADYALLQKQLQEAQAQLSSFNTKSQSDQMYVKAQLDEKTKKVAELEAQILSAQTEFSAKLDVATRQSQVQGQQINDLQKQLDQAKSAQSTVEAKATVDQSSSLLALQSQLSQGNQRIGELENQIQMLRSEAASARVAQVEPAAGPAAVIPAAPLAPTPVVAPVSYSSRAASSSPSGFKSSDDFSSLLKSAGVTVQGGVHAAAASSTSYRAYSWKTDSLYGSAEQRAMSSSGYEAAVDQYLSRAKSRCGGEYAAIPAQVSTGAAQSKAFEIACVNSKGGTSASVLFTYGNGVMTTIAHEGRAEAMDIAMEARDRVAGQVR
jgi:chromosome segregation ATPase